MSVKEEVDESIAAYNSEVIVQHLAEKAINKVIQYSGGVLFWRWTQKCNQNL